MTNAERLQMEIQGITLTSDEIQVYLAENGLVDTDQYNPTSRINKRNILLTALSILESIANNPATMKDYKTDDISVTAFAENLQNRIDQLERKIRMINMDEQADSSYFMLFKD